MIISWSVFDVQTSKILMMWNIDILFF